ncbi:MAG TPA: helix-turn-helix domain-containing protein [Anaerolineales bacterium]|nr:helix-turn-helix domain-containing protein [Anaerolineales bacterium]HLO31249.1 helix-turn-helix domain-containing protein [Anaerolineales bacterium]
MTKSIQTEKEHRTILTVREVAEYLRMSEAKVYRLAKERCLPGVRIGKSWRFRKDLLDDWLSKRTESSMDERERAGIAFKRATADMSSRD